MFDKVEIKVKAGDGGDGIISFHHEKFLPYGGPDGGEGGRGGDVIIRADDSVASLRKFKARRFFQARDGGPGEGNKRHGRSGEDLIIRVPAGTVISRGREAGELAFFADLVRSGDEVKVANGGQGGWGNTHFTSSTQQAPRIAQKGEPGEETTISLEMRLIADVGIIGYPNAGKSTLLAAASAARPKIAPYPFTTIEPVLGVVEVGPERLVMAEIPGLIAGAHLGKGLGHDFLRHILRTKILLHLLDGSSKSPLEDMKLVNEELALFDASLARKRQVVAVNKIDLPEVQDRLEAIGRALDGAGLRAFYISAATGEGVLGLMSEVMRVWQAVAAEEERTAKPRRVFWPQPRSAGIRVSKVGEEFVLSVPGLERMVAGAGVSPGELRWQLDGQLTRLGVKRILKKAGIKPGDKIRCGHLEWEW